ncbi:MAG: ABC transporter permease [Candidatus Odinarchaeia archaeon]
MSKHFILEALLIAKKELKQLWRDKASLIFTFLIPVTIMMAFTLAIPQTRGSVTLDIYVYNGDNSSLSNNVINVINDSNLNVIGFVDSPSELEDLISRGEIAAGIIIPEGFSSNVESLDNPSLEIIVDNSKQQVLTTVKSNLLDSADDFKQVFMSFFEEQLKDNISELNSFIFEFKDNLTSASFFTYGIPSIYVWGNMSVLVYGWQQFYSDNASAVSSGTISIYDVNSYANTSTYSYLTSIAGVGYPVNMSTLVLAYHQGIYVGWNSSFPDPYPDETEVYSVPVETRLNNVISNVLPPLLNSSLNESEREVFYLCYNNLSLTTWNNTEAIVNLTLNFISSAYPYLTEEFIYDVYRLCSSPSESDIIQLAESVTNELFNSTSEVLSVDESLLAGDLKEGVAQAIIVMGIALVFSCFDDIAGAMAREREKGTLSRLYLTPINRLSFFAGKTISSIILTIVRTSALLAIYLFGLGGIIEGSIFLIYLISILIAIVTIALGFLISSRNISSRGVVILQIAIMLPLIFFTGLIVPKELMPPFAKAFVVFIPYWYANDALRRVALLGQGFEFIYFDLIVLIGASLILFALAAVLMRRRI